ncbi:PREDICTED: interactor of constitutive active ROPs 2, chloroplastic-like isoform X1 [Nicotiana attenuata]|uniref:Interactor of constitutive active rops 2, chloroplastic n=1 Tax=Nicotiana attenuata TaxID=49451 RepID=A0A1J6HZ03_NICAT|nr:PREDICTED: interactor of constitutive active ROPs 2, chloroplastic-like isoform X1 [Nicotiana attenuata]XP_019254737.1 PREDICTED: interactor of constitutive active ROPs 2, chloroplastic-like isoform X1 [Nicotiana attenuata]XP_019254738.1 PREDICTED: interactor of constitutive active ROPs 2, chloroplastic-like isoform X1 [Nicotiana attenuata]XP_019254739.1 PREDICTED: interactor of constitutive active ROPs 2, chloroplastic-like isoform X1 [Nicotiana attenuata]XP_019254740.1 PREDICTED: interacto
MQTPKSRNISVEVPQRKSPAPKTARKLKTPGSDADSLSAPNPAISTPKDRGVKVVGRRSPRNPVVEKKHPTKVTDLETELAQLQDELKKVKDQLTSSDSLKRRAQIEAEEAKKQLTAMSEKLEESEKQLVELSDSEDARILELRKISQDRDRAWQSELEAVQKQHEYDSAALASAMNEIQKLKSQLDRLADSEANQARHAESAYAEIQSLRVELMETLTLVEKLRNQINDSKESEACALEEMSKAQMQLEVAKMTEDTLRLEGLKAMEACKSLSLELEQSNNQVAKLEELVSELQTAQGTVDGVNEEAEELKTEVSNLKLEVSQLRTALEVSERRYQEEYTQSTLQIRSAYELVERSKSESAQREAEWEAKLKVAKAELEELKEKLMNKEAKLQNISNENKELNMQVEKIQSADRESELVAVLKESESTLGDLRASLLDKETELQNIKEENEMLKSEIKKRETEGRKVNDETLAVAEAAKGVERETLMKLGHLTDEADESSRKAARVTEQLDAAQNANSEMEAELRRLKVQADQWRKAAEAAAAMLSTGNNGKYVERTGSLDYHTISGKLDSPLSEDTDDESPKKKNGNMLKKIGVLLKKGQK